MRMLLAALAIAVFFNAAPSYASDKRVHFAAFDVYLHSDDPVAAWQFELADRHGLMKVVGVENGESPAYPRAPYYDREAVRLGTADRIIVADYSLADVAQLPEGRIRVATVHLMIDDPVGTDFILNLITATSSDGHALDASLSFELRTGSDQ